MQKITKTLPADFSLKPEISPFGPKTPERDFKKSSSVTV